MSSLKKGVQDDICTLKKGVQDDIHTLKKGVQDEVRALKNSVEILTVDLGTLVGNLRLAAKNTKGVCEEGQVQEYEPLRKMVHVVFLTTLSC